jgi:hypothetical protein
MQGCYSLTRLNRAIVSDFPHSCYPSQSSCSADDCVSVLGLTPISNTDKQLGYAQKQTRKRFGYHGTPRCQSGHEGDPFSFSL